MSDRNYIAMRSRAPATPQACLYAAATLDPIFNESHAMPLPSPAQREYEHMAEYRGHFVATYKDTLDLPLYRVNGSPIYAVYFALDALGDPITPVDTCFWSPFLAMAMIDQYIALNEHDRKAYWKKQGPWRLIHQNYNAQHQLPQLLDTMRSLAAEATDPDIDIMYGDASEFSAYIAARMTEALDTISQSTTYAPRSADDE